jgi:cell division protein FtsZ
MPNPVRAQLNTIAEQVRAEAAMPQPPRQPISPIEPLILGDQENAPMEEEIPPMPAIVRQAAPMREMLPEPKPEPKRRRLFGGWSERKPEVRTEPAPLSRQAPPQRASSQVMNRSQAEPQRAPQQAQPELPELNAQEDFEIPAFLRRQTN